MEFLKILEISEKGWILISWLIYSGICMEFSSYLAFRCLGLGPACPPEKDGLQNSTAIVLDQKLATADMIA
ncbi:predicted protein [Methanosarcina acetivorans C2A]|uniref:Uncharacterized protein n=1 Tax=Methanosarcina acetivorans (strain ATCC 35395 / DSM 2834 / JCM 12185 / C2A) TaxID=188937 RepID=Q8TP56_METAC|nr:predicted protein [Methanosarcina acetivorans C2A]